MKKRGAFFSADALIAISIIFIVLVLFFPALKQRENQSELHYDILTVLSSLKIGEVDSPYVQLLLAQGKITNINKSILEQIGEFYIFDIPAARALAMDMLSSLKTKENIGIWYGTDLLASINSSPYETAKNIETTRQTISGIQKGSPQTGYVSKAWLKKIKQKKTSMIYRGDLMCSGWRLYGTTEYCGTAATSVTYRINVPENATIEKAEWLAEPSWQNQPTTLIMNGVQVFTGAIPFYQIMDIKNHTRTGNNTAVLISPWGGEDGASHFVIDYNTTDLQTFSFQTEFPFNEMTGQGVLYHEKGIFIPSTVQSMNVRINTSAATTLQLRKDNVTTTIGTKSPSGQFVTFSDNEIKTALETSHISYNNLSNQYFFFVARVGVNGVATFIGQNSTIEINYTKEDVPFGSIDITQKTPVISYSDLFLGTFYRNVAWGFSLPNNSLPIMADWQLGWAAGGVGQGAEQEARANGVILYQSPPQPHIEALSRFGYTPNLKPGLFTAGSNNFSLRFVGPYSVSINASYGAVTYFINSYVNYGDAKEKARGGTKTITFEDNSTQQISIGNSTDPWDPNLDAIDDSVDRLLMQLDANNNGKIDLILNPNDIQIESLDISGVPYLWSTEVQVRLWS